MAPRRPPGAGARAVLLTTALIAGLAAPALAGPPAPAPSGAAPATGQRKLAGPGGAPTPGPPGPLTGKYETGWNRVPSLELLLKHEGDVLRGSVTLVVDARGTRVVTIDLVGKAVGKVGQLRWRDLYGNAGTASLWEAAPQRWSLLAVIKKPTNEGRYFEGRYDMVKSKQVLEQGEEPAASVP